MHLGVNWNGLVLAFSFVHITLLFINLCHDCQKRVVSCIF